MSKGCSKRTYSRISAEFLYIEKKYAEKLQVLKNVEMWKGRASRKANTSATEPTWRVVTIMAQTTSSDHHPPSSISKRTCSVLWSKGFSSWWPPWSASSETASASSYFLVKKFTESFTTSYSYWPSLTWWVFCKPFWNQQLKTTSINACRIQSLRIIIVALNFTSNRF